MSTTDTNCCCIILSVEFKEWLAWELDERDWSYSELARRAGVSAQQVSFVMNDRRNPGPEFALGIARAFNIPPEFVFERAGLLPTSSVNSPNLKEATHLFLQLSNRQQQDILVMMRALIDQDRQVDATTS